MIDVKKQENLAIGDLLLEVSSEGYEYYYLVAASRNGREVHLIMINSNGQEVPLVCESYDNIAALNENCNLEKVSSFSNLLLTDVKR